MEIFRRLFVGLFGMIDSVIYGLITILYELLMEIANVRPFSDDTFLIFYDRIYALLGLFMLFKVAFSIIKYIINPDEFSDKSKGGKKMVINILIVLVMLVGSKPVFKIMTEVQSTLLEEGVVHKLILGSGVGSSDGETFNKSEIGKDIKATVFSAFYRPSDINCANAVFTNSDVGTACGGFMNASAAGSLAQDQKNGDIWNMIFRDTGGEPLYMQKKENEDGYAIDYLFIVSTIAGGFTAWIFLMFCFDIAIRAVKLGFLQLIAPIPIISYIDPSSGKNGMFGKWLKELGKTYLDLFVRLAAVYFAIALISELMKNPDIGTNNFFAKIFVIFGILLFAKKIPKLLEDLLGIKIGGDFSLNPMNRIRETPVLGALATGAAGLAGGAYAGFKAGKDVGAPAFKTAALGAITGAHQSAAKVGMAGAKPGSKAPKAFSESMNNTFKQMTNREMTNFNPVNMISKGMVQDRYAAVKAARNNAYARLNEAQTEQQAAYHQVQMTTGALNGLNETDRNAFMDKANYYAAQSKIRDDMREKGKLEEAKKAEEEMQKVREEVQRTYTGDYAPVAEHFNARVAAIEATSHVSLINKDIDDLSKEKAQIERFGHIDPVATRDANALIGRYSQAPENVSLQAPIPSVESSNKVTIKQINREDIPSGAKIISKKK